MLKKIISSTYKFEINFSFEINEFQIINLNQELHIGIFCTLKWCTY